MCVHLYRFMDNIYKFYTLNNSTTKEIFVFSGYDSSENEPTIEKLEGIENLGKYFTTEEIDNIQSNDGAFSLPAAFRTRHVHNRERTMRRGGTRR